MEIKLIILLLLSSRGSRFNDTKLFLIVPEL